MLSPNLMFSATVLSYLATVQLLLPVYARVWCHPLDHRQPTRDFSPLTKNCSLSLISYKLPLVTLLGVGGPCEHTPPSMLEF